MRVCMLTSVHSAYDVRIFYKEAMSLSKHGYDVTIIAPKKNKKTKNNKEINVIQLDTKGGLISRFKIWGKLIKVAREGKYDLYHFHDPELLFATTIIKFMTRKPIVYDVHEYFVDSILYKNWIPRFIRPFTRLTAKVVERFFLNFVDGIVLVDDMQKELYEGTKAIVEVVKNYPSLDQFESKNELTNNQIKYIGYFGTINENRGIYTMLETMKLVKSEYPNLVLLLAGNIGSEELRNNIESKIKECKLEENVKYLGKLDYRKLMKYYKQINIGWSPGIPTAQNTVINKGRGIATKIIEYMALGIPVISSDMPQRRKLVEKYNCGILVKPDSPTEHYEGIKRIVENQDLRESMSRNGRKAFEESLNWEFQEERLLDLYEKLKKV